MKRPNEYMLITDGVTRHQYEQELNKYIDYLEAENEKLNTAVFKHPFSSPEEIAFKKKWKTQDACQVPFSDLPIENRLTMIELCIRFFKE